MAFHGVFASNTAATGMAGSSSSSAKDAAMAVSTQPTCTPTTWTPAGCGSRRSELVEDPWATVVAEPSGRGDADAGPVRGRTAGRPVSGV